MHGNNIKNDEEHNIHFSLFWAMQNIFIEVTPQVPKYVRTQPCLWVSRSCSEFESPMGFVVPRPLLKSPRRLICCPAKG
jgi:hypothetical protein